MWAIVEVMSKPGRHQHVVSAGLQRLFADGERILRVTKATRECVEVGVRDNFVASRFNSRRADSESDWDDELEREWARMEGVAIPLLREAHDGRWDDDVCYAVNVVASMHFARSYAHEVVHFRTLDELAQARAITVGDDPELLAAFRADYQRSPQPGEIRRFFDWRVEAIRTGNGPHVEAMARHHNMALEKLAGMHVQLIRPATARVGFVLGDVPVVVANDWQVGSHNGVALGDADTLYMPIARRLAVLFTTAHHDHAKVGVDVVQLLNCLAWRASVRSVAMHPAEQPGRALGAIAGPFTMRAR
jgi:hypothetical protein